MRCSRLLDAGGWVEGAGLVPGCSTSNVTEHGAEVTLKMLSRYINNNIIAQLYPDSEASGYSREFHYQMPFLNKTVSH